MPGIKPLRCWVILSTWLHFLQQWCHWVLKCLNFYSLDNCLDNLRFALPLFSPGRRRMERAALKTRAEVCVVPGLWSTCSSPPASMRRTGPSVRMMTGWAMSFGDENWVLTDFSQPALMGVMQAVHIWALDLRESS